MVTSDSWRQLLCGRLPALAGRVAVVTNTYPEAPLGPACPAKRDSSARSVLLYAGRFSGSRLSQDPAALLEPLLAAAKRQSSGRTIRLVGELSMEDLPEVGRFQTQFSKHGWTIEMAGSVPRGELLRELPAAGGLLLLSASHAAIPSKLFEYIAAGRPILIVTFKGSATWLACQSLRQAFLVEATGSGDDRVVDAFLRACDEGGYRCDLPREFSDSHVEQLMLAVIRRNVDA
jgi:hypothetical protein